MKRLIVFLLLLIPILSFGQHNFEWDITDSCNKLQEDLFIDSKVFIAYLFKTPNSIVEGEDFIIFNGVIQAGSYRAHYDFMCHLMFKDNKYRIIITNVECRRLPSNKVNGLTVFEDCYPPFEGNVVPQNNLWDVQNMNREIRFKQIDIRDALRKSLNEFIAKYQNFIKHKRETEW